MNERIKELALQAMTYVTHNPKANKLNSGDNNEFRGCVIISKHFGVEE